jgi:hypothetical protein
LFESVPKGIYEVKGTYGKWIYKGTGSTTVDLTNIPDGARVQVILAASENAVSPEAEEQETVDLEVYPTIRSEDELTPIWGDITISLIGGEFSRSIVIGRSDPDPSALFESVPKGVYEVKGTSGRWILRETGKTTVDLTNMPDGARVQVILLMLGE